MHPFFVSLQKYFLFEFIVQYNHIRARLSTLHLDIADHLYIQMRNCLYTR